ncbi:hypothetical protein N0X72_00720 [Streptomyces carpaticus]|uniref:hypothetical protein n=1 Tax=Streptomyces TaxID=1883 RepID=UPI0021FC03D0|nr:hypothetical protein N0X72_00720 [Streptomyces carpaticus]
MAVLALEFPAAGAHSDFAFLGSAVPAPVSRVDPLLGHTGPPRSLGEQAEGLLADLPAPPALVLAYCAAAALGLRVGAAAGAPVVLVDPDPVVDSYLRAEFAAMYRTLGGDPERIPGSTGPPDAELSPARLEALLFGQREELAEEYGGDAEAAELVDDLLLRYRSWLRFLAASSRQPPVRHTAVTIVSGKPLPAMSVLLVTPEAATSVPVEAGGAPTLAVPEARHLIARLVREQAGG